MHFVPRKLQSQAQAQQPHTSTAVEPVPKLLPRQPSTKSQKGDIKQGASQLQKQMEDSSAPDNGSGKSSGSGSDKIDIAESYSYVQFAKKRPSVHEYSYPQIETLKPEPRGSTGSLRKQQQGELLPAQPPLLPTKAKRKEKRKHSRHKHLSASERARCRYCQEMFSEDENVPGNCEDAPDCCQDCINVISCTVCARCMLYHCMSDPDGDYVNPCSCDTTDDTCVRRWAGLTILSLFVPCLWCYFPLQLCHRCGSDCGCCGGRHKSYT